MSRFPFRLGTSGRACPLAGVLAGVLLEELLKAHTWFREGTTGGATRSSGTLGGGWLERYHIDAAVHEFNCNWIEGLQEYPSRQHWEDYGAKLTVVFDEYFAAVKP